MNTKEFSEYLLKLGGLHDAVLVSITWQIDLQSIELEIDDFYANFSGLPEYPGHHIGNIKLEGVTHIEFDITATEKLNIFEILPVENRANEVIARFSPSGSISIRFTNAIFPVSKI